MSKDLPRSRHTTCKPALASSIDMIEPTTPLPTTTTSTDFNFVVDISVFLARLVNDVSGKAFGLNRHPAGLDGKHADGFGVVSLTASDQAAIFAGGQTGKTEQLPTDLATIAAIEWIGKI